MGAPSFEEMRAAYLATVLDVDHSRVLSAVKAWNAINPVPAKSKAVAGVSKAMGLQPGVHDLVFCWQGRFIGVEIKDQKGRVSDAQKAWHAALRAAGGQSYIIRDVADLAFLLRRWGVRTPARVAA